MIAGEFGGVRLEKIVAAADEIVERAGAAQHGMSRQLLHVLLKSIVATF